MPLAINADRAIVTRINYSYTQVDCQCLCRLQGLNCMIASLKILFSPSRGIAKKWISLFSSQIDIKILAERSYSMLI